MNEVAMIVNTKAYGAVEVDERQMVTFPFGLLGFERFRDWVVMDARQEPFMFLQSLDSEDLAFVLIDPFLFCPDYVPDIDDKELSDIGIDRQEDAVVFAIVTVPRDGGPMTANLAGPVVINKTKRQGRQAILQDQRWQTKHDILAMLAESRK